MQNIEHPNIIKLYESVDTLTKISLVVEYGGDLSLLEYLKKHFPLSEATMKKICHQMLSAISYLHDKNIVHRDIKLQNVLMLQDQVKLIDFGFSTLSKNMFTQPTKTESSMLFAALPTTWHPRFSAKRSISESKLIFGHLESLPLQWARASTPLKLTLITS